MFVAFYNIVEIFSYRTIVVLYFETFPQKAVSLNIPLDLDSEFFSTIASDERVEYLLSPNG